jgi:hypothetical protein
LPRDWRQSKDSGPFVPSVTQKLVRPSATKTS